MLAPRTCVCPVVMQCSTNSAGIAGKKIPRGAEKGTHRCPALNRRPVLVDVGTALRCVRRQQGETEGEGDAAEAPTPRRRFAGGGHGVGVGVGGSQRPGSGWCARASWGTWRGNGHSSRRPGEMLCMCRTASFCVKLRGRRRAVCKVNAKPQRRVHANAGLGRGTRAGLIRRVALKAMYTDGKGTPRAK